MECGNNIELVQQMPAKTKKNNIKKLAKDATSGNVPSEKLKNKLDKLFGVKSGK